MAKPLVFRFADGELAFQLGKVDRAKLYGFKETEVVDEKGKPCELATLADDGRTVVGRGGTGIGYVSADGLWCDKTSLTAVDLEGQAIKPVPSSYSAPIDLTEKATVDEYLAHNIRLVYAMDLDRGDGEDEDGGGGDGENRDGADNLSRLVDELRQGVIYKFPYSFRGGLVADAGFLLAGEDGDLFLTVGSPTKIEMVGFEQFAFADQEDDTDETDLMDFDMM